MRVILVLESFDFPAETMNELYDKAKFVALQSFLKHEHYQIHKPDLEEMQTETATIQLITQKSRQ